jgi:hypothetical protein
VKGLSNGEKKEPEWWCRHHKENTEYLCHMMAKMIQQFEDGDEESLSRTIAMMKAQLPAFEATTRM